ncbi:MAG: molecular chaperone HtpG, partial [Lentisphaeria bacterium]
NMERILAAMGQEVPKAKRILELNANHPLMVRMNEMAQADIADTKIEEYANLIFDLALLTEGTSPRKPLELAKKISELMVKV